MDAGLVVVLAVLGAFLMVPLGFAWVSTNPRRWGRVEGVLGREPRGSERLARWAWAVRVGIGATYLVMGIVQVRRGQALVGWAFAVLGSLQFALGAAGFLLRARVRRERSVQPQIQDRPEAGGPGPGG
jgi:hypothetical protein